MSPIEFTIPVLPPSKNGWEGRHWSKRHRQGEELRREIWAALAGCQYPHPNTPTPSFTVPVLVEIELHFPDKRRRDVQNYIHPGLLDALVALGVIVDDSAVWMALTVSAVVDGRRATIIRIREREAHNEDAE